MAMEEILGYGKIIVEVEENVRRELAQADRDFERYMDKWSREEANLRLGVKTKDFYKDMREALARKEQAEKDAEAASDARERKNAKARLARADANLNALREKNVKLFNKIVELDEKRTDIAERHAQRRTAIEEKGARDRQKIMEQQAAAEEAQRKKTAKAIKDAEEAATRKMQAEAKKRADAAKKAREAEIKAENDRIAKAVAARAAEERERQAQFDRTAKAIRDAEARAERERVAAAKRSALAGARARQAEIAAETRAIRQAINVRLSEERRAANEEAKLTARQERDRANSASLQRQYIDLARRRNKIAASSQKVFITESERVRMEFDVESIDQQMEVIRDRLNAINEPPTEIDLHVNDNQGARTLSKWASAISDTAVRVGPFTTSIAGLGRALFLLGPIITGVAGAVLNFGSAVASGVAGGLGVAGAAVLGFIPLIGGMAMAFKPYVKQLLDANKAQDAYDKAVRENGKNSEQAKNALKKLNNVMKSLTPETRKAMRQWDGLRDSWKEATDEAAKRSFGQIVSEGIQTATDLLPMFARQTNRFMRGAAEGISGWMQRLRSEGGRNTLDRIFTNANEALGPFMRGLGNLGAAAGKVFAVFSEHLPSLASGFERWSDGLNKAADNTSKVRARVGTMVDSMRSVGKLAKSVGSLLFNFISVASGQGGGNNFLRDMADGLDDMNRSMMRNNGEGLATFLRDSTETAKDLYETLKPLVALFWEWATIMRPFTTAALAVAEALGDIVSTISQSGVGRFALTSLFGIFLGGALVGKILAVKGAVQALIGTMRSLGQASVALRALDVVTGGGIPWIASRRKQIDMERRAAQQTASATSTAAKGAKVSFASTAAATAVGVGAEHLGERVLKGTSTADKAMANTTKNAGKLRGAMGALTAGGAAFGPWGLAIGAGAAAASFGIYKLITAQSEQEKAAKQATSGFQRYNEAVRGMPALHMQAAGAGLNLAQSQVTLKQAQKEYNALQRQGKLDTEAGRMATLNLRAALLGESDARMQIKAAAQQEHDAKLILWKGAQDNIKGAQRALNDLRDDTSSSHLLQFGEDMGSAFDEVSSKAKEAGIPLRDFIKQLDLPDYAKEDLLEVADAADALGRANRRGDAAARQMTLATLNMHRSLQGMIPVTGRAATALVDFRKAAGKANAIKIATRFEAPKDVQRVTQQATSAIRSGVPRSIATRVAVNSRDADQAVRRLSHIRLNPVNLRVIMRGDDEARRRLNDLVGVKLAPKVMKILANKEDAQSKYNALRALKIPDKIARYLANTDDADAKRRRLNNESLRSLIQNIIRQIQNPPGLFGRIADAIQWVVRKVRGATGGADGGMFAQGGTPGYAAGRPNPRQQERAAVTAGLSGSPRDATQGRKVTKPVYLVGEENTPEFVIATNPKYRKRNKQYLAQAASALGMTVSDPLMAPRYATLPTASVPGEIPAYASGRLPGMGRFNTPTKNGYFANQNVNDLSGRKAWRFNSKKTRPKNKNLGKVGKKKYTIPQYAIRNPWTVQVKGLMDQQQDAERELSMAQGKVEEPEDFIKEVKDKDGNITYEIDRTAMQTYKDQLAPVEKWQAILQKITAELVQSVPKAITSLNSEIAARKKNIAKLEAEITRQEKRLRTKSKGGKGADAKRKAQAEADRIKENARLKLKKLRPALAAEKRELGDARSAKDTFEADVRKEAGFDYREYTDQLAVTQQEIANISDATANAQIAAAKESAAGSGTGTGDTGGDTGPTIGQQNMMADTERANILREFGSNAGSLSDSIGSGGISGGMQANIGSLSPSGGSTGFYGSGGTSGGGSMSGVMSSLAGGSTAGSTMAAQSVSSGTSGGSLAGGTSGGDKTVNITNNFATAPQDPHTWSAGVAYEAGALL